MTILCQRKPLVLWRPFVLVFYCPPATIYCRCSSRLYDTSVSLRARSFTLTPDISARIDYASSSLSDVLVSIGDRCGRNAHVPVFFRPELLDFLSPFKFHVEFLRSALLPRLRIDNRKKKIVGWDTTGNLKRSEIVTSTWYIWFLYRH